MTASYTVEQALTLAVERGLHKYSRQPYEDYLLLAWQQQMLKDGEFVKIFHHSCLAPAKFFDMFKPPNTLYYSQDPRTQLIDVAMWFEPSPFGAFCGVWMHKSVRHGPAAFKRLQAAYAIGFSYFELLGGVTTQEALLPVHRKLGYTVACKLPYRLNDRPAWLIFFSREAFACSKMNPFRLRSQQRRRA